MMTKFISPSSNIKVAEYMVIFDTVLKGRYSPIYYQSERKNTDLSSLRLEYPAY